MISATKAFIYICIQEGKPDGVLLIGFDSTGETRLESDVLLPDSGRAYEWGKRQQL
jgi:hypothetical protein